MEQKTYKHRHLKVEIGDVLIGEIKEIKVYNLTENQDPTPIVDALKVLEPVGHWWVEETVSKVTIWKSEEIIGRYTPVDGTSFAICKCGHERRRHNKGEGYFGTSCFHRDGHDIYCGCDAFVRR